MRESVGRDRKEKANRELATIDLNKDTRYI